MAQNGGQSPDNKYAKLEYRGYSGGLYSLELTNKQNCGVDFQVEWLNKDTTIYVVGTQIIQLPGAAAGMKKIKAKPLYRCGSSGGDLGWVEIETPASLPVKFTFYRVEQINETQVKVIFEIAEARNLNRFVIKVRANNGEFKPVMVLFPDEIEPNRRYSVKIDLPNERL